MKKLLVSIAIAAFLFAGCSGNQNKEQEHTEDIHKHDDGSVHGNHEEDSEIRQEEFTVPADTPSQNDEPGNDHTHEKQNGNEHPHKH